VNISTPYPVWYLLLCIAGAAAASWWLYRKNKIPFEDSQKWQLYILSGFRFLAVTIIFLLLFNPLLNTENSHKEKPLIVVAVDNSQSVMANKDSAFYRTTFADNIKKIEAQLGDNFEVKYLTYGEKITDGNNITFAEKQSDYSTLISGIYSRYENNNIGALILAGDGLYNKGVNPVYEAKSFKFPVFTVALGDTNHQRDIRIKKVKHNEIAYLGNTFPVNIAIVGDGCNGEQAKVSIIYKGNEIFNKNIIIDGQNFTADIPAVLDAKESGLQHYTINVTRLSNEISYINNTYQFAVEVLDGKQKILLAALSPHPDLGALKKSIESNKNYEAKIVFVNELAKITDLKQYNLVVMHQLPGTTNSVQNILNNLRQMQIPTLFIGGTQSNWQVLSSYLSGLRISSSPANENDAIPIVNGSFSLFSLSENLKSKLANFPPLKSPFGNYNNTGFEVLANQQVGYVKTNNPLIALSKGNTWRVGVICGEGIWRWHLADFSQNKNYDVFDEIINKTVQYLGVKSDLRRFRLVNFKTTYLENEPLQLDAEVYNPSYELDNKNDVEFTINTTDEKLYKYTFSKTANAYTLNAGILAPGIYTYIAKTMVDGKQETINGIFSILPLQNELGETVADHNLLGQLAQNTGGNMFYPKELDKLVKQLKASEVIKPIIYTERETTDLINLKWLFIIILLFMSVEWLVRKINGVV